MEDPFFEITTTITFRIQVDKNFKYPPHRSEAGKAAQTAKRKLKGVLKVSKFEDTVVREIKDGAPHTCGD